MQLQVGVFWEAYSEPSQTCNMELFDRGLNVLLIFTQLLIKIMKHDKKDTPMNQEQVISTENLMNIDSKYFKINIAYKQKYHFGKDK